VKKGRKTRVGVLPYFGPMSRIGGKRVTLWGQFLAIV